MSDVFKEIDEEEEKNLFNYEGIFTADYEPQSLDEVIGRNTFHRNQVKKIGKAVKQTIKPDVRAELYVYGVSGVGKTYTVKAVLKYVPKEWAEKFQYAWVNCRTIQPLSPYQIMKDISIQMGKQFGKGKGTGFSTRDLKMWLIKKHKEKPLLIVFDEVDTLVKEKKLNLLYIFFEAKVSQILISNVYGWENNTDNRIKSRAKTNRVDFPSYNKGEMSDILSFIAERGLKEGVVSEEILEKITEDTINKFAGDVRKGKHLIDGCVREAMDEGVDKVTEEHIAKAYKRVQPMSLKDILKNFGLPVQAALAGFVIQKQNISSFEHGGGRGKNPATTMHIHYFYEKCSRLNGLEPIAAPMMRDYLAQLKAAEIIGFKPASHETRGRTNVYYSNYNIEDIGWALTALGIKLPEKGGFKEFFGEGK